MSQLPRDKLPLADAAARLRGRPGRPRKPDSLQTARDSVRAHERAMPRGTTGLVCIVPLAPRLLDLVSTAVYLGVSEWTVRDLEAAGVLARVRVPLPNGGELRRLLFDHEDLDRLITTWKDRTSPPGRSGV